jgi:F-type H+-transporting ATPase subunit a
MSVLAARAGFEAPSVNELAWPCIWTVRVGSFELCVNRTTLLMIIGTLIVGTLFWVGFRRPQLVPRGVQNLAEAGVDFIRRQIVLEVIGPDGLRFVPYLTALFFYIFFVNVFEIVPGINFPVGARMAVPGFLALMSWLLFNAVGIKEQGLVRYLRSTLFPPGLPWPLYVLIVPIEFISTILVRPVTLSVRLLANMLAGHLILGVFFLGTAYLIARPVTAPFAVASFAMSVILVAFELAVGLLQAYIFTILTAVYLAGALLPEH